MQDLLSREPVLERFFNYVSYDTQAKPGAKISPKPNCYSKNWWHSGCKKSSSINTLY